LSLSDSIRYPKAETLVLPLASQGENEVGSIEGQRVNNDEKCKVTSITAGVYITSTLGWLSI